MAAISRSRLIRWIAPAGALVAAIATAAALALTPATALEDLVYNCGLAVLIPAAEPPLGATATLAIALGAAAVAAAVAWSALFLLFGPGGMLNAFATGADGAPAVRHADSHPDAPPRRPLSAHVDLGAPMPAPPPAVRPLPVDLDQPIAAFHPAAIPAVPREPVRPLAPLSPRPLAAGEWIESVDLTPSMPRVGADALDDDKPSIESLLRRLETARPRRLRAH